VENLTIRKLKQEDTPAIIRIYRSITRKPDVVNFQRAINELSGIESSACFVADLDGQVIGYMASYVLAGSFGVQPSAWIPMVGVHPDVMGQGIGKQLAEAVFEYYKAKKIHQIYTSVRWYDADLLSFFRTLGFDRSEFIPLQKQLDK
jgi:N-acetylglutamate synthase-like GNAT family acetyltransferase